MRRKIRAALLAALLGTTVPASAATASKAGLGSGSVVPMVGLLASRPELRSAVIAQIAMLQPGAPVAAPAPLSARSVEVVRGLLRQPELLRAHAVDFEQVLGVRSYEALAAASGKIEALPAAFRAGRAIDPSDEAAIAKLDARMRALFDGGSAGAGAVPVPVTSWRPGRRSRVALAPAAKLLVHRSKPGLEKEGVEILAKSLPVMELPPVREEVVDNPARDEQPPVVFASLPSIWKLAVARQGSRQSPGNVLIAMDSSWITQEVGANGRNKLLLTKGLQFDKDGRQASIVTYKRPRRIGYFVNLLTMGAFDRDDGVILEKDLDTPMSSSSRLEQITNDKLWTRLMLAERNIRVPATRAFMMPAHRFLKRGKIPSSPTVQAMGVPRTRAEVRRAVVEFLQRYKGPEVVVKPSGARFHSGEGVDFFGRERVDDITDYVIKLSKHAKMEGQGAVLLEQRLAPPPIYLRFSEYTGSGPFVYRDKKKLSVRVLAPSEIATAADHEKKDYNQRVYAVRTPSDDGYAVPMTFFRAGTWGLPTSSQPNNPDDAAAVISFETMLEAWRTQHGLMMSAADVQAFEKQRDEMGRAAMLAIMANEKKLRRKKGDAYQGQTDMIGLDAMYQVEDGKLVKYYIEVNDHDAAGQHALDLFYPDRAGEHSASWIDLGLWRARHSQP